MFGAVWAQAETRKVLGALGARVLDRELPVPMVEEQFTEHGERLADEALEREIAGLLGSVDAVAGAAWPPEAPARGTRPASRAAHRRADVAGSARTRTCPGRRRPS